MGYSKCFSCGVVYDNSFSSSCPKCNCYGAGLPQCRRCGDRAWMVHENSVYCTSCEGINWGLGCCSGCSNVMDRALLIRSPGQRRWGHKLLCEGCLGKWYKKTLSAIYSSCEDSEIIRKNKEESRRIVDSNDIKKCTCNNKLKRVVVKRVTKVKIENVIVWCTSCGRSTRTLPYSKLGKLDRRFIASISDHAMDGINICGVSGCNENGAAEHHYAPRGIFENAEDWPIGYLCKAHHYEWHEKTKTGYFKKGAS